MNQLPVVLQTKEYLPKTHGSRRHFLSSLYVEEKAGDGADATVDDPTLSSKAAARRTKDGEVARVIRR